MTVTRSAISSLVMLVILHLVIKNALLGGNAGIGILTCIITILAISVLSCWSTFIGTEQDQPDEQPSKRNTFIPF